MLKALLLDLDETLCNTQAANDAAIASMQFNLNQQFGQHINEQLFTDHYIKGIYRDWTPDQAERYLAIIEQHGEAAFRVQLIIDLLQQQQIQDIDGHTAQSIQDNFDNDRLAAFDFYPGIVEFLASARQMLTLVVITNGPVFSQQPKIDRIQLASHVDHIIIGGQEPEQKPAKSIFEKALNLADCEAHEAIHVGDSLAADIQGAHNSGITSLWVQHQQPLDAELGINPHHSVMHPSEIPAMIRRLSQQPCSV